MDKRIVALFVAAIVVQTVWSQRVLSLDSCRTMALRNNKQMSVSRVKQKMASNLRKSARTQYLPRVSAVGGYLYTSRELSILSDEQKDGLTRIGSLIGNVLQPLRPVISQGSQQLIDAFETDTRHTLAAGIVVTQPVFMGGAIMAANKLASINEQFEENSAEVQRQATLYQIEQTYWQVVSLRHKQKLAQGYLDLVKKLDGDVQKMIREGVATRSEGLSVSVKVNEAEMTLMQVEDGLSLSRMLLCQLCGLPVSEQVILADEDEDSITAHAGISAICEEAGVAVATENRPELKMLQNAVDMSKQTTNILKAGNLPQVLLMGGWAGMNPNLYNGFEHKFKGAWNVGVLVRVSLWNWGDVMCKVRAAKGATTIAELEMEEIREKIELQVSQSEFHVNEAAKKLEQAWAGIERAEENLRTANLGFSEGVISSTTVMEAQTAWLQARSQLIDAEIDVKLSQVNLQKALGTLQ